MQTSKTFVVFLNKMNLNRKGFEMAISTMVLFVIGIFVLIGLIYAITGGFKSFKSSTDPFLDTTQSSAIKQSCVLACQNQDKLSFCCNTHKIQDQEVKCSDSRLEVSCGFTCDNFDCGPPTMTESQCTEQGGLAYYSPGDSSHVTKCTSEGGTIIGNIPVGIEGGICCKK